MVWRRAVAAIGVMSILAGISACATDVATGDDDVWVSVYQPRPDVAAGRIALQVHNDSDEQVIIESAALASSYFTEDLVWPAEREAKLAPGNAVDLRVQLADSECDATDAAAHTVTLTYRLGDAASRTVELEPVDEFHVLDLLHDAGCLVERVAEVATLTAVSVSVPGQPGVPTALTVAVEPTGAAGSFTVHAVTSTTLLAPADNGIGRPELALGIAVDASGPTEFSIPLVPNRCDPHALAEDKVGTRIPLLVTAPDGSEGRLVLAASDELRGQMYAFFSSYCGLG